MSDDLISRSVLMQSLRNNVLVDVTQNLKQAIAEQPTVCDMDKIIERLKELKTYKLNMADAMSEIMCRGELGNYICLEDVLQIIKSGGVADE